MLFGFLFALRPRGLTSPWGVDDGDDDDDDDDGGDDD